MPKTELEIIKERLDEKSLKALSTDTVSFRMGIFKKIFSIEDKLSNFGCVFDKATTEKHEKKLEELSKFNTDFDKKFDLFAQEIRTAISSISTTVGELKTGRDDNSKRIDETEKSILEGKTALRVSLWFFAGIWVASIAILGGIFYLHDRVPHDNPTKTVKESACVRNDENEKFALMGK